MCEVRRNMGTKSKNTKYSQSFNCVRLISLSEFPIVSFILISSFGWKTYTQVRCALALPHFLKFIKFINKILYFYILFYLYLYN